MTVSGAQQKAVRSERRIIERPRLIKLLDETDARTILLLAPAGYGKTTLARQWAKTLNGAIWLTLTPAHCDIAWLAEDIANEIERQGGQASRAIREQIHARMNPQKAARELGRAVGNRLESTRAQWLVLDDYQEISSSPEAEELLATIAESSTTRMLVASRSRPDWVSDRQLVYGEIFEVGRPLLAMTEGEATAVIGPKPTAAHLSEQAKGWPAVIGLAAAADTAALPDGAVPQTLHRYLADELFHRASAELQVALMTVALAGVRPADVLEQVHGSAASPLLAEARELGFSASDNEFELHPLLREFLLEKLMQLPDAEVRVRTAVSSSLEAEAWDHALSLILRFKLFDLIEPTLCLAFRPLNRSGRLATLAAFCKTIGHGRAPFAPSVDVVRAEVAFRDGNFELAMDIAEAVQPRLGSDHMLRSPAATIVGQISLLQAEFSRAEEAFRIARDGARDERDETEAAYGLATASIFGEQDQAAEIALDEVRRTSDRSPVDFLRATSCEVAHRLLGGFENGLSSGLHLEAAREALPHAEEARARTNLTYTLATALAQRADYQDARDWLALFYSDASEFDLEFALPYANWSMAQIAMGQRRFGEAERALQKVEDFASRRRERHIDFNARSLRARLLLQNGDVSGAVQRVAQEPDEGALIPSWRAEYFATRALALACANRSREALSAAASADRTSRALEVRGLTQAARAIVELSTDLSRIDAALGIMDAARRLWTWDPVICALRSSICLADSLAEREPVRPLLEDLYRRTNDSGLARRAGFRTRSTDRPHDVLSPREYEVLGLIASGYKNREISRALFISDSTTKVHVRHILEKLGVRTRSEAVARLKMFEGGGDA